MLTPSRKADMKETFHKVIPFHLCEIGWHHCKSQGCRARSHKPKKMKPRQTYKHDNKVLQKTINKVEERERKFYALMWELYLIPFGCDDDET